MTFFKNYKKYTLHFFSTLGILVGIKFLITCYFDHQAQGSLVKQLQALTAESSEIMTKQNKGEMKPGSSSDLSSVQNLMESSEKIKTAGDLELAAKTLVQFFSQNDFIKAQQLKEELQQTANLSKLNPVEKISTLVSLRYGLKELKIDLKTSQFAQDLIWQGLNKVEKLLFLSDSYLKNLPSISEVKLSWSDDLNHINSSIDRVYSELNSNQDNFIWPLVMGMSSLAIGLIFLFVLFWRSRVQSKFSALGLELKQKKGELQDMLAAVREGEFESLANLDPINHPRYYYLQQAQEIYQLISKNSKQLMAFIDREGELVWASQAWMERFQMELGESWSVFFEAEFKTLSLDKRWRHLRSGVSYQYHLEKFNNGQLIELWEFSDSSQQSASKIRRSYLSLNQTDLLNLLDEKTRGDYHQSVLERLEFDKDFSKLELPSSFLDKSLPYFISGLVTYMDRYESRVAKIDLSAKDSKHQDDQNNHASTGQKVLTFWLKDMELNEAKLDKVFFHGGEDKCLRVLMQDFEQLCAEYFGELSLHHYQESSDQDESSSSCFELSYNPKTKQMIAGVEHSWHKTSNHNYWS